MRFFSRKRQTTSPTHESSSQSQSVSNDPRMSVAGSNHYPSWLPERPGPPVPRSTVQTLSDIVGGPPSSEMAGPSARQGRKPTPRSVRLVMDRRDREPTDHTRVVSKATGHTLTNALENNNLNGKPPTPRFRHKGLRLELLESTSIWMKLYFYFFRILVFVHIPIQTFLDFNAVYILFQISKFPNPQAPNVPGNSHPWTFAFAAYIICTVLSLIIVTIIYEVIYSFARHWRTRNPSMYAVYFSAPAFTLAGTTSYTTFCFLQRVRFSVASVRQLLAESANWYAQNLPTVALLLPRAGLSMAILLGFSRPAIGVQVLADQGVVFRDGTFFRVEDGSLSTYAQVVLWFNIAWTGWRTLLLCLSWLGLWIFSEQAFAGLCGPRYRWEEEEFRQYPNEKRRLSFSSDSTSSSGASRRLPWSWRQETRLRILEAYEFCLTPLRRRSMKEVSQATGGQQDSDEGIDRILAAVGLGSAPPPARRGVLTDDFFSIPPGDGIEVVQRTETPPEFRPLVPDMYKVVKNPKTKKGERSKKDEFSYPFTGPEAAISSSDAVPFPGGSGHPRSKSSKDITSTDDDDLETDEEVLDETDAQSPVGGTTEDPSTGRASGSMSSLGQPVTSRYPFQFRRPARGTAATATSGTSSSPTSSHVNSNGRSLHSTFSQGTQSTGNVESTTTDSRSIALSMAQSAQSYSVSGSGSGSGSAGGRHHATTSDLGGIPTGGLPMPPRHPAPRARAGTVPVPSGPVAFPRTAEHRRGRPSLPTDTTPLGNLGAGLYDPQVDMSLGPGEDSFFDDDIEEVSRSREASSASHDDHASERGDSVGLLEHSRSNSYIGSNRPSPRSSLNHLKHVASNMSLSERLRRSRSNSASGSSGLQRSAGARTHSHSGSSASRSRNNSISLSIAVRSRAQSLMQQVSRSSVELAQAALPPMMRSRANSEMARLEEDVGAVSDGARTHSHSNSQSWTHSRSGSASDAPRSSSENYTFGQPLKPLTPVTKQEKVEEGDEPPPEGPSKV